eukprot:bmy_18004T0
MEGWALELTKVRIAREEIGDLQNNIPRRNCHSVDSMSAKEIIPKSILMREAAYYQIFQEVTITENNSLQPFDQNLHLPVILQNGKQKAKRRGTCRIFSRPLGKCKIVPLATYVWIYKKGDIPDIKGRGTVQRGTAHTVTAAKPEESTVSGDNFLKCVRENYQKKKEAKAKDTNLGSTEESTGPTQRHTCRTESEMDHQSRLSTCQRLCLFSDLFLVQTIEIVFTITRLKS